MEKEKNSKVRWDVADIILGNSGKNCICKHINESSDLYDRKDIQKEIYEKCCSIAYGSEPLTDDYGPTGDPQLTDFAFEYKDEEIKQFVRFRVAVQLTVKGPYFCLRRINGIIPSLAAQGYGEGIIQRLLNPDRRGLVLFSGEMGTGKTTGAAATIHERLERHGGTGVTLEDPPEYNLQGGHGKYGFCMQRHVHRTKMADEIPGLMRASAPEIIFLGEIRDPKAAQEVILAASNGHLILSTIHGKGITGTLSRLISLSSANSNMSTTEAANMLANSLSLIVHQKLKRYEKQRNANGGIQKVLEVQIADFEDSSKSTAFIQKVAKNEINQFNTLLDKPIPGQSML